MSQFNAGCQIILRVRLHEIIEDLLLLSIEIYESVYLNSFHDLLNFRDAFSEFVHFRERYL